MSLGPVSSNKDGATIPTPLLLCAITFSGQLTPGLLLSTTPITLSAPIGILPAGAYAGRIAEQDIEALQHRSEQGVDRPLKVTLHLYDSDHYIWNNFVQNTSGTPKYGFRGGTLQMALILMFPGTTNFTSDAPVQFVGTLDAEIPLHGFDILSITANTGHDTATVKLPMWPIQNRCPKVFPTTPAQRLAAAFDSTSKYWQCGYSADVSGGLGNKYTGTNPYINSYGEQVTDSTGLFLMCDYLRSDPTRADQSVGCMARMGKYSGTGVAYDGDLWHDTHSNVTGVFGGIEWNPPGYYTIGKNYINNSKQADFSFLNQGVLGQYQNLLYGTQWVNPKIANVLESGNDTKCKAMICTGNIGSLVSYGVGGVQQVVCAGINISRDPSGDANLWWQYMSYGNRGGIPGLSDTGYSNIGHSQLDDPYGSIACIEVVVYSSIFTGFGTPSMQILATGPQVMAFVPLTSVSGSGSTMTITFAGTNANAYFAITPPSVIQVVGTTLSAANAIYTGVTGHFAYGPPAVATPSSSVTGSGTGGYGGALSQQMNNNSAWVLLDILTKCNWALSEIAIGSFCTAADFCSTLIDYVNNLGNVASHSRFICQFSLESRKSGASVISAVLRSFNGYLYYDPSGLLNLGINQTLADAQPAPVTGSNYNTAVASYHADGSSANGYVAYSFDESNITRVGNANEQYLDIQGEGNATILTPNQIYIQFQDSDNQYVVDSLGEIDSNAVTRAGGALQPGGSLVPETLDVLGISNMDQAVRIANVYLAERQYGNLANDPRGTAIYTFSTTVRAEHLRSGHLVLLSLQAYGYTKQLFRVIKRVDSTNSQQIKLTVQFHNDVWYTDAYGQQPQAFYSTAGIIPPPRQPLPWQPYAEQPNSPASGAVIPTTEWSFQLTELDGTQANGNPSISLQVAGCLPINQPSNDLHPPLVPTQNTSTTSGTVPVGNYIVQICAIDATGVIYSAPSGFISCTIAGSPAGFVIGGIGWIAGAAGYDVFVGTTHYNMTSQLKDPTTTPSSITISSLPNEFAYAPPDLVADSIGIQGKEVIHGGIIGEVVTVGGVTSTTIQIGAPGSGTLGSMAGRTLMLLGRPNLEAPLPIVSFKIASNVGSVLTVDRNPTGLIFAYDVVVILAQANISSATTIGDTKFVNAYSPTGVSSDDVGYTVRIIEGLGEGQTATIVSVDSSGTFYNITPQWAQIPNSNSVFIVEEPNWRFNSTKTPINASGYTSTTAGAIDVTNYSQTAVLVQPIIYDASQNLQSNSNASLVRMIWLSGVQGTRLVTTSQTMLATDLTIEFDTTGITGSTDTLNGAINSSVTTVVLTSGTTTVTGTYIRCGSEWMYITSGGGTTTLTVARGQLGTTAASHSNGDTVDIGGALTFTMLPISGLANQEFIGQKITSITNITTGAGDLNYVIILTDGTDVFPDGSNQAILADNSASGGMIHLKAPGN